MKGSSPQVTESAAEKQAATNAQNRWNERSEDGYLALEKADVAAANDDYTELFAGRNAADVARAERVAYAASGTPTATRLGEVGNAIGEATVLGKVDAANKALQLKDSRSVAALSRGNDLAGDALKLGDVASDMASSKSIQRLQNKIMVDNSRTDAILTAAGGAAQGHSMNKAGYRLGKGGITTPTTSDGKPGRSLGFSPFLQGL